MNDPLLSVNERVQQKQDELEVDDVHTLYNDNYLKAPLPSDSGVVIQRFHVHCYNGKVFMRPPKGSNGVVKYSTVCTDIRNTDGSNSSSTSSRNMMDDCIVGGVLWKFKRFAPTLEKILLKQPYPKGFLMVQCLKVALYFLINLYLGQIVSYARSKHGGSDIGWHWARIMQLVMLLGILLDLGCSIIRLRKKDQKIPLPVLAKLDIFLHELSQELEESSSGYLVSQDDANGKTTDTTIVVRRSQQQQYNLPKVTSKCLDMAKRGERVKSKRGTKVSLTSLLVYEKIFFKSRFIPVDDWLLGGLLICLRDGEATTRPRSRRFMFIIVLPIAFINYILFQVALYYALTIRESNEVNDGYDVNDWFKHLIYSSFIGCTPITVLVCVAFRYIREGEGDAYHRACRTVIQKFNSIAMERSLHSIHYDVQPADCLPNTTKGEIRFEPLTAPAGELLIDEAEQW